MLLYNILYFIEATLRSVASKQLIIQSKLAHVEVQSLDNYIHESHCMYYIFEVIGQLNC